MVMFMPFHRTAAAILAAVLLTACATNTPKGQPQNIRVEGAKVETVRMAAVPQVYEAVGAVQSETSAVLAAQISGAVLEVRVKPGDRVKRGQVLARLDDRSSRAQLAAATAGVDESKYGEAETIQALTAAEAERKLAENTFHRYQQLLARNSVTKQEYDNVETRYKSAVANQSAVEARQKQLQARGAQAQSQVDSARALYSYSTIVSPVSGVVTAKSVDPGTVVMPGTPLLTVEDAAHYRFEAGLPQELIAKVRLGQEARISTDEGQWTGKVVEIAPAADASTRTFLVKVALPATCECKSGEYGKALFTTGTAKAITVPNSAISAKGQLIGVYVVNDRGLAEYRLITTGKSLGDRVEILSGLSDGERVVISDVAKLSAGARVVAQ